MLLLIIIGVLATYGIGIMALAKVSGRCSRWEEQYHYDKNIDKHVCIYNIDNKCYERPCISCNVNKTCDRKCTADCLTCKGYLDS